MSSPNRLSLVLKVSVFATGLAGIVAEYVLSTLATYLLGNAVFQWTIIMSFMLFAMGLGSRLSQYFSSRLIDLFIFVEFTLSILCASASALAYGLAAHTGYINLVIYTLAVLIGLLIGFEIPLVTRINQEYEELRTNIAMVMEKDYYGALVGGLLFAFVALPYLGLTYTPIALGAVNFLVAGAFFLSFSHLLTLRKSAGAAFALCAAGIVLLVVYAKPIIQYGEQSQYKDKVIYAQQTKYQKIVMTQWREYFWLYINSQVQFSSYDEEKYHEPLVHPALMMAADKSNVLILGGGDGLAVREILKHPEVKRITLVDLDPAMTALARTHPVLRRINQDSMQDERLRIIHQDAGAFLRESSELYSVIIIDLPDPDSVDLMHVYDVTFYRQCAAHLQAGGVLVTQAASPYFAPLAFVCINKTLQAGGFATLPIHNQAPTMGEWGWVLAQKASEASPESLRARLAEADFSTLETRFLNNEAATALPLFGKGVFDHPRATEIEANTRHNPILMRYYEAGAWAMY